MRNETTVEVEGLSDESQEVRPRGRRGGWREGQGEGVNGEPV